MALDERLAFGKRLIHRAVSAGLSPADFLEVTEPIELWEDWCAAWSARGEMYEREGRTALDAGHGVSAARLLRKASICYHFGCNLFFIDPEQARAALMKSVACYRDALPHQRPAGQRIEVPFEGGVLPGVVRLPAGVTRPPLVIVMNGLDSSKEEFEDRQTELNDRGVATLSFDGPGQSEAQYDFPMRGDFEVAARAVVDFAIANLAIDADRIGVYGISMGGYYAPRAAAFDDRIKACIALSGPYDLGAAWEHLGPLHRELIRIRGRQPSEEAARAFAGTFSLAGVAQRIKCALYVSTGTLDYFPYAQMQRLADEAAGPVHTRIIDGYPHVPDDRNYAFRTQMADWIADQLTAGAG